MKKFCDTCEKEVNTEVILKKEIYTVCGENIEVEAEVLVCKECCEELFCEELDNQTLVKAYNEYRKIHKLLLPEEIKNIREQYGLSQRSFAKMLNWGDKTINRYENGSIQDKAHNSILLFLKNPENMKKYIEENEILLDEKIIEGVLQKIEQSETTVLHERKDYIIDTYFNRNPSVENGFKTFDYDKMCEVVLFFANKEKNLPKTKLLKLLNYTDMLYFKENSVSLTGSSYVHLPYGPVVKNYDILFGIMAEDSIIHIDVVVDNKYEKHQVIPNVKCNEKILNKNEIDVLTRVYNKFAKYGSVDISKYSHNEKGYVSTVQGEIISYEYAKDLIF